MSENTNTTMSASKPYLIRAMYEWIVDNGLTPYLVVDANQYGVDVPLEYVQEGRIVLNVSPRACRGLHLENDKIIFTARFHQAAVQVVATPEAVIAIYAQENGKGMVFEEASGSQTSGGVVTPFATGETGGDADVKIKSRQATATYVGGTQSEAGQSSSSSSNSKPKKKSHLTIIK